MAPRTRRTTTKAKPFQWTPKRERFCTEYPIDLNGAAAARRAGYSERTANLIACELLEFPEIAERIQALLDARAKRTETEADRVLREIGYPAFLDIAGAFSDDGALLPIHQIPEEVRRAIASIEVDEITEKGLGGQTVVIGHTRKVKFVDKKGSLELLGRHLKLFTDQIDVNLKVGLADKLAEARARAAGR